MLSLEGWANGLSGLICLSFAFILGIGVIYQGKKIKANLIFLMGINIFISGFLWSLQSFDFLYVILTGTNLIDVHNWIIFGILRWMWPPIVALLSIYIGAYLMIPEKKQHMTLISIILCIIYELLLFINPTEFLLLILPEKPGTDITTISINPNTILTALVYGFQIFTMIFCGFGYFFKGIRSKGVIKKKFFLLSLAIFMFAIFPLTVNIMRFLIGLFFIAIVMSRLGVACSFVFFYLGLREEPEKPIRIKKKVKVKEALFRLTERPKKITEEEVTYFRENKICLVCKGKVEGFNAYICDCDALYCVKCARALSKQENACWVCKMPFDKSSPSILFQNGEESLLEEKATKKLDKKKKSVKKKKDNESPKE